MSTIFHVDVNSAFLSWSAVKLLRDDPGEVDLRTIPSIVGGDRSTRHGIVTAASIPAKKLGIRTADTVASAFEKCPDRLIILVYSKNPVFSTMKNLPEESPEMLDRTEECGYKYKKG